MKLNSHIANPPHTSLKNILDHDFHLIRLPVGAKVRRLREKRGWSLARLASEAKIDEDHLAAIELGEPERANLDSLARICRSLGASVEDLFSRVD